MILWTFYSPEFSQFEIIFKLQLCSCNLGQFPELHQRSMYLIQWGSAPDRKEKHGATSSCDSNMSFKQFNIIRNLMKSPMSKKSILFHPSFIIWGNAPDYEIKLWGARCLVIPPDYKIKYGSSCDSTTYSHDLFFVWTRGSCSDLGEIPCVGKFNFLTF